MSKIFIYTIGILLLFLICGIFLMINMPPPQPAPSPALQNDKLNEILTRGRIVIATDPAYPPNSELKPGASRTAGSKCAPAEFTANQFTGFDVAVAVETARRMGVEPCFVTPAWTQITGGSWADRWDLHFGSMTVTPERMKVLYFTQPYFAVPAFFYVHKDNTAFSTLGDLSGRQVGTCAGCTFEQYLQGSLDLPGQKIDFAVRNTSIVAYDIEPSALADLALGDGKKLDAVLTNQNIGQHAIDSGMPIKPLDGPVFFAYAAAVIDKKSGRDQGEFVEKVTGIIQQMHRDGTLLNLSEQYFGRDRTTEAGRFNISTLEQFPPQRA